MLARCDRSDLGLRQRRQNQTIGNVDTKLIATAASARVASKSSIDPIGRVSYRSVLRDRSARHPDIDELSVLIPDRVDPCAMLRHGWVGPIPKGIESAAPQQRKGVNQSLHVPAFVSGEGCAESILERQTS
jgi:hypothetical protein